MRATTAAAVTLAVMLLSGCQDPDVGQPCTLAATVIQQNSIPTDYFESGNTACENLVCIKSPDASGSKLKSNPYCSKPCVADKDCSTSETGLVCRPVTPDPNYIATLPPDVQAAYRAYAGNLFTSYCAAPLP